MICDVQVFACIVQHSAMIYGVGAFPNAHYELRNPVVQQSKFLYAIPHLTCAQMPKSFEGVWGDPKPPAYAAIAAAFFFPIRLHRDFLFFCFNSVTAGATGLFAITGGLS